MPVLLESSGKKVLLGACGELIVQEKGENNNNKMQETLRNETAEMNVSPGGL